MHHQEQKNRAQAAPWMFALQKAFAEKLGPAGAVRAVTVILPNIAADFAKELDRLPSGAAKAEDYRWDDGSLVLRLLGAKQGTKKLLMEVRLDGKSVWVPKPPVEL